MSFEEFGGELHGREEYTWILAELHNCYYNDQPEDTIQYCFNFFYQKLQDERCYFPQQETLLQKAEQHPLEADEVQYNSISTSYDSEVDAIEFQHDEEYHELKDKFPSDIIPNAVSVITHTRTRRVSVSAESLAPSTLGIFVKKCVPKSIEQTGFIKSSINKHFLFKTLDEEYSQDVVNAMVERIVTAGEKVIEQGALGDYFYVVKSGSFDCFVNEQKVCGYETGGSFGELALMYNSSRAATIVATSTATLWTLDRVTFRTILIEKASQKREMYESFLEDIPILKSLEKHERHKIADVLESVYFMDGEHVILQGNTGDRFYLIESGKAMFYKTDERGEQKEVNQLERGGYFGELSLLNNIPRATTVIAKDKLKCATLGKEAFTRLLGSVHNILKRNSENYHTIISQQQQEYMLT